MAILNNPDILREGMTSCKEINNVLKRIQESEHSDKLSETAQQEVIDELFELLIKVATLYCGDTTSWTNVRELLRISGVEIPEDFDKQMMYMEKL